MQSLRRSLPRLGIGLPLALLGALLAILLLAGGASRADALGQAVVRGASWAALIAVLLLGNTPTATPARPVLWLLAASILLVALQLVPLPPSLWQALPGRGPLAGAAVVAGIPQPWRPLTIAPWATLNALSSLVVPLAVLLLARKLGPEDQARLRGLLLVLIALSALIGLLQFSGAGVENVFVNYTVGDVSGTMANRNHFALLMAVGCLVAPVWAFSAHRSARWRAPFALALLLLFLLVILASGSRAGLLVGSLATVIGIFLARRGLKRELAGAPKWLFPALLILVALLAIAAIAASVLFGRAIAVDRAFVLEADQEMRARALPVVLDMVRSYFPAGAGFGSFDLSFRLNEPFDLLKPTYFNHAHDDFLELLIDGGLPAAILVAVAMGWWAVTSVRAWAGRAREGQTQQRLGSAILMVVFIASVFDYPARTPLVMAILVLAAIWLCPGEQGASRSALPGEDQHL